MISFPDPRFHLYLVQCAYNIHQLAVKSPDNTSMTRYMYRQVSFSTAKWFDQFLIILWISLCHWTMNHKQFHGSALSCVES